MTIRKGFITVMRCSECKRIWNAGHDEVTLPLDFECPTCRKQNSYMAMVMRAGDHDTKTHYQILDNQ